MKAGDLVKLANTDGAVCVEGSDSYRGTISNDRKFEVIGFPGIRGIDTDSGCFDENAFIIVKNTYTKNRWLLRIGQIKAVSVKEVTMADLAEKYGCPVKVIK